MELNLLRSVVTVLSFAMFVGLLFWAWSRQRREDFDEAARLPFEPIPGGDDADR